MNYAEAERRARTTDGDNAMNTISRHTVKYILNRLDSAKDVADRLVSTDSETVRNIRRGTLLTELREVRRVILDAALVDVAVETLESEPQP